MACLELLDSYLNEVGSSRGQRKALERYAEILVERNKKINLVASSTLPDMWKRHFWDSAQLLPLLPSCTENLVDLGSGAGFPGLVLAILGVPEVHLVESTGKKALFLQDVVDDLSLNVTVHHARCETIQDVKADVVTARAVKALPSLLSLAKPFWHKDTAGLFLKGQKVDAELTDAKKYWTFNIKKVQSLTDPSGTILALRNLRVRKHHGQQYKKSK